MGKIKAFFRYLFAFIFICCVTLIWMMIGKKVQKYYEHYDL